MEFLLLSCGYPIPNVVLVILNCSIYKKFANQNWDDSEDVTDSWKHICPVVVPSSPVDDKLSQEQERKWCITAPRSRCISLHPLPTQL